MTLARFAKKRDGNEAEIVATLRRHDALVFPLDRPVDLLVGYHGRWVVLEVKRPLGVVGEGQARFMAECRDKALPAYVVRSADDALGVLRWMG